MFKETIENNAEVKANTKELEALKKHFPSCFDKEGKFDIKIFEELVKTEEVDIKKEGYSLNFLGKSYARYLSSLDSETVIVPDENNNDIDSENIYIVGDNLDALQHLKYSYSEKIKCIYIDPPYNTGSDGFVYNDKFEFTAEELAKKINIEDDEAERILNMQGKSTHSAWLAFMYPRLELAKELLSDDGVMFINIDENEAHNLQKLTEEIFGDQAFDVLIWRKNGKQGNTKKIKRFKTTHEYIVAAYKNKMSTSIGKVKLLPNWKGEKSNVDNDPRGKWESGIISRSEEMSNSGSENYYSINLPSGRTITREFYCSKKIFQEYVDDNRIYFPKDGDGVPRLKIFENEEQEYFFDTIIDEMGTFSSARDEIKDILGNKDIFDTPKPVKLIKELIRVVTTNSCIILDFFSGSATTAHAVMQLNMEDGGNRKYIMVQLPEETEEKSEAYRAGYATIDEIGRERIRRAAAKIREEEPEKSKSVDLKFKTYYLQDIDTNTLDKIREFNPLMPIDAKDIQDKFGKDAIVETWKIRDGFGFNASLEEINLSGYTAYKVSDSKVGVYLYLLDDMESEAIQELVRQLEAFELNVDKIIEYGYSFSYNANTALRANLKTLKNKNAVDVLIRY